MIDYERDGALASFLREEALDAGFSAKEAN